MSLRVAILDSGLAPGDAIATADFSDGGSLLPHGHMVASLVRDAAAEVEFLDGRVFGTQLSTSADQVAEAVLWAVAQQARIINLSLGLREDRAILRAAINRALAAGCLIVATAPARGGPVYPAAYDGVIAVTGDARCDLSEFSWLGEKFVDFGANPRPLAGPEHIGGASFAAARVTGALAKLSGPKCLEQGNPVDQLRAGCRFSGRERRLGHSCSGHSD